MMRRPDTEHLPWPMRQELCRVTAMLFEAFAETTRGRLSEHYRAGRILTLILHGAHATPDRTDAAPGEAFHLIAIVNHPRLARSGRDWRLVRDELGRAWEFGEIGHPVRLTVESLDRINGALTDGVPHFVSIMDTGIVLYEVEGLRLAKPRNLPASERRIRGLAEYARWHQRASDFLIGAAFYRDHGNAPMAALLLHQTCEHLYQSLLWSLTLHGPRTHALDELREAAEATVPCLRSAWPRESPFERRAFGCIRRAYVEVRYGHAYRISGEELAWAMERVAMLQLLVRGVCDERLEIEPRPLCFAPPFAKGGGHVLAQ
jgi:HEPN domain-containing protein